MTIGASGTAQSLAAQQQQQLAAQQQQAASQQQAAQQPAPAASGMLGGLLGMFKTRVKPIDENFVVGLAQMMQDQQTQLLQLQAQAATAATQNSGEPLGLDSGSSGSTDAGQGAASVVGQTAAQQVAAEAAKQEAAASKAAVKETNPTYAAPAVQKKRYDSWSAHIAQFRGAYLQDGPTMRPNCGPASVTTALRLVGLDVPGFNGQRSEAVLDQARIIATGQNNTQVGTTDTELERVIQAAGGQYTESTDFNQIKQWAKQGVPVILAGNPAYGWDGRYTNDQVYNFNGGHWVTVSGYDSQTGNYIVNDPLSQIGPIEVSEAELANYTAHNSGLGIAVYK